MKILMMTRGLPFHGIGGMEVVAWDLAKKIAQYGHEITIITTPANGIEDRNILDGVEIRIINSPSNKYSKKWIEESKKLYLKEYIDHVDIVLSVSAAAKHLVTLERKKRPVFVLQAHGTSWGEFLSKMRQKKIISFIKSLKNIIGYFSDIPYRRFDSVIAIGEPVYQDYTNFPSNLLINNNLKIIKNGIDYEIFKYNFQYRQEIRKKYEVSDEEYLIVSCSRLHEQKGVIEALNAFEAAYKINNNLRYFIIGTGSEYNNLKALISHKKLTKVVHLLGSLERLEIAKIYSGCDIFLFLSKRNEGLPINVLEACSTGLPVFLTKFSHHSDFNSIVLDDLSPGLVAKTLINWIRENKLGVNRENYLPVKYSLDYSAKKYISEFEELL